MAKSGKDNCSMNLKKLEDLIEEHQHELIQHAYLLTGNMGDAEDIVQEAYIKFFRLQIELRNPKNAKSYLFKMVHFACIDLIRKNKNQQTIPINGHENLICFFILIGHQSYMITGIVPSILYQVSYRPASYQTNDSGFWQSSYTQHLLKT